MATVKIFRINYKSDFILTLNSDAGWMTPFCIKFWTGAPSQAYFVSFDGTTYTHCAPVAGEPTKLQVQFDDHHLPIGDLKFQIGYHFTVADFPNDTEDEVLNQASVIIEQDGEPAKVMLDFNGETAPEIEFSLPAYANEAQRIENEEQRIENEQARVEAEEARVAAENARVDEFAQLKTESEEATANANAAAHLATEKAALAKQKADYAKTQGDYAKAQGDYAKAQGDYAKSQGDIAQADHQRAESDHATATADHTQAASDHSTATADHTQAASDHSTATADHTQAAADHTRAEGDHTRAESDHEAVEVYVDSLGAFDISAYHATGGVLAKYADLTAALGTGGANIPDTLRKGGMSVKFVQSSDNKYVKFFCTADEFTTDVTKWQGVDNEPTAGSDNLVKSCGVANSFLAIEEKKDITYSNDSSGFKKDSFKIKKGTTYEIYVIEGRISAERVVDASNIALETFTYNMTAGTKRKFTFGYDGLFSFYYVTGSTLKLRITNLTTISGRVKELEEKSVATDKTLEECKVYLDDSTIIMGSNKMVINECSYKYGSDVVITFEDTTNPAFYIRKGGVSGTSIAVTPSSTSITVPSGSMLFCVLSGNSASLAVSDTVLENSILIGVSYYGFLCGKVADYLMQHLTYIDLKNVVGKVNPAIDHRMAVIKEASDNTSEVLDMIPTDLYEDVDVSPTQSEWLNGYVKDTIDNIVNDYNFRHVVFDVWNNCTFIIFGKNGTNNYRVFDSAGNEIKNGQNAYFANASNGTFVMPANAAKFVVTFSVSTNDGSAIKVYNRYYKRISKRVDRIQGKIETIYPDEETVVNFSDIGYELGKILDAQGNESSNQNTAITSMFTNKDLIRCSLYYDGEEQADTDFYFRQYWYDNSGTFINRSGTNIKFGNVVLIAKSKYLRYLIYKYVDGTVSPVTEYDMNHIFLKADNYATKFTYEGNKISIAPKMSWRMLARASYGDYLQDGDCYGDTLFLFYDQRNTSAQLNGLEVIDLSTGAIIQQITLGYEEGHHNNAVCFGPDKWDDEDDFPLLYASGLFNRKTFVYRITGSRGSYVLTKVQTITVNDMDDKFTSFIDKERKLFVTENTDDATTLVATYRTFDLPDPTNGDVDLSVANAIDTFDVSIANPYGVETTSSSQGGCIINGKLYQVFGFNNRRNWLQVINLSTHVTESTLNFTDIGLNFEPEGTFYYKGNLGAMFNGGTGRYIIEMKFN